MEDTSEKFSKSICSTKNDEKGVWIWGYGGICGPDCLTHEEAMTWRKDESFKMSLQFHNDPLWTGLELYGKLLAGIFIYASVLTTLISAIGKI